MNAIELTTSAIKTTKSGISAVIGGAIFTAKNAKLEDGIWTARIQAKRGTKIIYSARIGSFSAEDANMLAAAKIAIIAAGE